MGKRKASDDKRKKNEGKKEDDGRSLKKAIEDLPRKKRIALAVVTAVLVTAGIFFFVFQFIEAVTPERITEEDYLVLLSKLDGRVWSIKKDDEEKIASSLYSFRAEGARTEKSGETLLLIFYSDREEYTLHFTYRDGCMTGFIGSLIYNLYHSSGKKGNGRALSLVGGENRITLFEE